MISLEASSALRTQYYRGQRTKITGQGHVMSEVCTLLCYFVVMSEADVLTVVGNQTTVFWCVNCMVK